MEFDPSRRKFLKESGKFGFLALIFSFLPASFLKGIEKNIIEQAKISFENLPYPDIERVPELLRGYFESFPKEKRNWSSVAEDQKRRVGDFLDSDIYKTNLKEELTFSYKEENRNMTEEGIGKIVADIISLKKEDLNIRSIRYEDVIDAFGFYDRRWHYVALDTLGLDGQSYYEKRKGEIYNVELAAVSHEFWHVTQGGLFHLSHFLFCTYKRIIDLYKQKGLLKDFDKNFGKIKRVKDRDYFVEDDRFLKIFPNFDFYQDPLELTSFLHSIKQTLSLVCEFNKNLGISFDLNKDNFTQEHLDFLKINHSKIFQKRTDKNIFERLQSFFTDDEIILLMKYNV